CAYVVDGKAVFVQHGLARCRCAETVDAEHVASISHITMPTLCCTRFNSEPSPPRRRQHGITFGLRQGIEQIPAGHRHTAYRDAFMLQACRCGYDQTHLGAT